MNIFGVVDCGTSGRNKNTGFGDCQINPKLIKGGAYVPSTFKLTREQLGSQASAIAALKAAAKADLPEDRIYPIHGFINPSDNTEDKTIRTSGDGNQTVVRDGLVNWSWEFTLGGLALHRALRSHNENGGYFIFWDEDYNLYGWGKNREIYGIPLNFKWVNPWKQNDGSNPAIYTLQVVFLAKYTNDEVGLAKVGSGITDVKGLRDVEIVVNSFNSDNGHGNFSLLTLDSAYNLFDKYNTELDDKALYFATNAQSGNDIGITSVTAKTSDKTFDFVLSTVDVDYPTLDGEVILLKLDVVSELELAGVEGFEGIEARLTIGDSSAS